MRSLETLKRFKPGRAQLIGGAIILSSGILAWAAAPNIFTAGSTISAAQVNANFTDADTRIAALEAKLAASVACPNTPTRFTDKGDGTVCDSQTGLMWEIKTGTVGTAINCTTDTDCPDAQNVNNTYTLSAATTPAESSGTLYTNLLERVNDLKTPNDGATTTCFAGRCDWRVPSAGELRSILLAPYPGCTNPCIAAGFPGPVVNGYHWSSSPYAAIPTNAWYVDFLDGNVSNGFSRTLYFNVRLVRAGQ